MTWRGAVAVLVTAALLLAGAGVAEAQMYKCVDARGKLNYSDKPCPTGSKGAEVDIKGQAPISGRLEPQKIDPAREEQDFQRRRIESERQAKNEERERENRRRQCSSMQSELERLGRARVIDEKARDERMAKLRADIARQC
jgi:hypothetical protein